MSQSNDFPRLVIEKLGYYVYLLRDPKTHKVFYVGKGTGNQIFAHINSAISSPLDSDKLDKIRSIQSKGLQVRHSIIRHGLTEKEALEIELSGFCRVCRSEEHTSELQSLTNLVCR